MNNHWLKITKNLSILKLGEKYKLLLKEECTTVYTLTIEFLATYEPIDFLRPQNLVLLLVSFLRSRALLS